MSSSYRQPLGLRQFVVNHAKCVLSHTSVYTQSLNCKFLSHVWISYIVFETYFLTIQKILSLIITSIFLCSCILVTSLKKYLLKLLSSLLINVCFTFLINTNFFTYHKFIFIMKKSLLYIWSCNYTYTL